ncbi:pyrroline-5-carboxylate reductase [Pseudenhygromyxa sp. WMMC2535]|uniref:pyrroline-5-carboxylate reductase n=1 Tax=Pseudenhygromyxa sp. WMMC2535 TaxID=2712867 RepID=UPI001557B35B|nr:pyrroline-5-carboxylate reductase [Pseudenhygromyxa sp. WMMC2535]NVB37819.1 pyrroline-5-carboxylate reductase [Pseudenhygromyxa sp. WMMC2535]
MLDTPGSLCVLGCGTMGEAITEGLLRAGWLSPDRVVVTARRKAVAEELHARLGVQATTDNLAACRGAEVVLVCLKPQRYLGILDQPAMREALKGKLLISIAAGVTLDKLGTWLPETALIRAMPNTPSLIREGMTVLCRRDADQPNAANDDQLSLARRIFDSVGVTLELEPKHMDAVTSLNGSGPAFVYVMLEAMADGGVMMGLPRDVAVTIAAQVFRGAAAMVLDTDMHPAALKDQVTTPAGCTIAGILTMEDGRIRSVLARTIQEAAKVASGLG